MSIKRTRLANVERLLAEIKNDLLLNEGLFVKEHAYTSCDDPYPNENSDRCLRCRILDWESNLQA